jgi:hypothetical protein
MYSQWKRQRLGINGIFPFAPIGKYISFPNKGTNAIFQNKPPSAL